MSQLEGQPVAGRYLVQRVISHTERALVCEAQHDVTGRQVALKLLADEAAESKARVERLLDEAKLLASIRHPCIVDVLDAGMSRSTTPGSTSYVPFVALELLDGRSLEGLLAARGALELADVLPIAIACCRALDAIHRRDRIHDAIAPYNVFLPPIMPWKLGWNASESSAKLIGLSTSVRSGEAARHDRDRRREPYQAPERRAGEPPSVRADLYALCAVLYECLTDTLPTPGSPAPHERDAAIPRPLSDAIMLGLSEDPDERAEDAHGLADSLWSAPQGVDSIPPRSQRPQRRSELRAPYVTPVGLEHDKLAVHGRCEDISLGGMLVLTSQPLGVVPELKIRFALPGRARFVVERGAIRWNRRGRQGLVVSGVQFLSLTTQSEEAINEYVEHYGRAPMHRWGS